MDRKLRRPRLPAAALVWISLLVSFVCPLGGSGAQPQSEPYREELLNGLRVLLWPQPGDANVLLKLRINSGAAFDLAGKAGTMALLGDALFPDPATREYFAQQLGGKLEVSTDYDAINISMSGPATDFERMVEFLRAALVNTPLDPPTVARILDARLKLTRETGILLSSIADRAAASRLYGDYPYGRPVGGTPASLARIQRPDLMFARERFLNPDNSTLVVAGGVDEHRAMRALRQLLGNWTKSGQIVPPTFRQPEAPDPRPLVVDLPGAETAEVRLAARGLARSDRDFGAAMLLSLLARDRWQASLPALGKHAFFVRHDARTLPGIFVMGASVPTSLTGGTIEAARNALRSMVNTPASPDELGRVRSEALAVFGKQQEQLSTRADLWLDGESYRLKPVAELARELSTVTAVEMQGAAARIFRETPLVTVVVGNAVQLRPQLDRLGQLEVKKVDELEPKPAATPAPATPAPRRP